MRRAAVLAWLCLGIGKALADPGADAPPNLGVASAAATSAAHLLAVRAATHDGFGRLVFEFSGRPHFTTARHGDVLVLTFDSPGMIGGVAKPPRNMRSVTGGPGRVDVTLAPGAQVRSVVLGGRLVLDVLDPTGAAATAAQAAAAPAAVPARPAEPVASATPVPIRPAAVAPPSPAPAPPAKPAAPAPGRPPPAQAAGPMPAKPINLAATVPPAAEPMPAAPPSPAAPAAAPVASVQAERLADIAAAPRGMADRPVPSAGGAPLELVADHADLPAGEDGAAIALPFSPNTGAAAFRRGGVGLVVFDERRPIDLGELHDDPVFFSALVQLLPNGTLLRLALPQERELRLLHSARGWVLAVAPGPVAVQPIKVTAADRRVDFAAGAPGQVVTVADPNTGGNLLVGTQRAPGQGLAITRQTPEFVLLRSWQGVAVEPQSDRPALRVTKTGFTLSAAMPDGLAVSPTDANAAAQADAAALTRSFDFTDDTVPALLRRMQSQVESAATAQPLARLAPREAAAQSMIALGMGAEAQALLQLAVAEDPRAATDPTQIGLSAIGALLAGRMSDTAPLTDRRLPATDEVALWRAVRDAMRQEGSPSAAAVFAAEMPLITAYPEALRTRLLPLAAETMALGGQVADAARLLAKSPEDPTLALARGMLAQAQGNTAAALAAYDAVAQSRDQLASARAGLRAAQLRLSSGEIGPEKAADAEERLLLAWRGDGWEVSLRRQVAQLRAQAGQWRQGLAMLRESEPLFPDDAPAIHAQMLEMLAFLLHDDTQPRLMAPLDLVALVEENADLLPDGPAGESMAATFADRLEALDLPKRADPVLDKLMRSNPPGPAKAVFGLQLATLRLDQADAPGALAALAASASDGQSAALQEKRALLQARAAAATGDQAGAVALLRTLDTPAADEARASVLEGARDWPGATAALVDYVGRVIPPNGPLDSQQAHILLRLATAAAQSGNEAILAQLRRDAGPRIAAIAGEQKLAETFRFLTQTPVATVSDLPRAAKETAAVRNLPDAIGKLDHTASK